MAQLSPLIQFTAGTPAVADDVNSNFTAIRSHINSANIDTENIAATLTSRVGGPILFLDQASQNEIAFSVQNSQTNTAMQILQSAPLAINKSVIKLKDTYPQTVGKAELWLELATGSTIPALLVEHGADVSMSLTKTQLNLFNSAVQATSAGVLSATIVNATTANLTNANTTGLITATAPVSDAIALKVKGRSSDNNAVIQFKSNNDATIYASATSSPSGLTLNLPDTADSYTFQVNGATKGVINNSGIDGQYIYNLSASNLPTLPSATSGVITSSVLSYSEVTEVALGSITLTTSKINSKVILSFGGSTDIISNAYRAAGTSTGGYIDTGGWRIVITGPSGFSFTTRYGHNAGTYPSNHAPLDTRVIQLGAIGTYTFTCYPHRFRSTQSEYGWNIINHRIYVSEIYG